MMKRSFYTLFLLAAILLLGSCSDNDTFSNSSSNRLSFTTDTLRMDTVFSTVPSSTRQFWIHNNSGDGIRIAKIRLANGNQKGFRVNVDGEYMSQYQLNDVEIRKGDSILVFVELTAPMTHAKTPVMIEDELEFILESGVKQTVCLNAYAWDAEKITNLKVSRDTTLEGGLPRIIYGDIKVDSGVTLTLKNAKLFFHDGAGFDVYGRLVAQGTATDNVELRGDRLDKMFDYLPYDHVSGQWKGIRLHSSSFGNSLSYTDLHSAMNGIVCDSSACSSSPDSLRLSLLRSTIHNNKGFGVLLCNASADINECQITNCLYDGLAVKGGRVRVSDCTLAQFYPLDWTKSPALSFTNHLNGFQYPLYSLNCANSIITGYEDEELAGSFVDSLEYAYEFHNCIIRSADLAKASYDSAHFYNVRFESPKDTIQGEKHFLCIDRDQVRFDFRLDSLSTARGFASPEFSSGFDRNGCQRSATKPDAGCYEMVKEE